MKSRKRNYDPQDMLDPRNPNAPWYVRHELVITIMASVIASVVTALILNATR